MLDERQGDQATRRREPGRAQGVQSAARSTHPYASKDQPMNRELIDRYAAGGSQLAPAIAGLSREQLNAFPVPGTWSIQQIVLHLMDSDLIASDRMKRVAAEESARP